MSPRLTWTVDEGASAALTSSGGVYGLCPSRMFIREPPFTGMLFNVTLRCGPCGKGATRTPAGFVVGNPLYLNLIQWTAKNI